ncbi:hypothetical protein Q31b_42730 [Novipirellula aureliae]|uniref:Uncharacterized protein n=1 Tax=Novipirellula aureliae TaxID=2527966 RepID=A0A5C6DMV1_9BACT|nr:hypothetical protein Q31b_42730 [Novipirellula aureliae]
MTAGPEFEYRRSEVSVVQPREYSLTVKRSRESLIEWDAGRAEQLSQAGLTRMIPLATVTNVELRCIEQLCFGDDTRPTDSPVLFSVLLICSFRLEGACECVVG